MRLVILAALTATLATPAAAETRLDPSSSCRVFVRDADVGFAHRWSGACDAAGSASGLGVLRLYNGDTVARSFLGEMRAGQWHVGMVVEGGDGALGLELGGYFVGNERVDGLPPDVPDQGNDPAAVAFVAAVDAADRAATALARRYAAEGNTASAAHYRRLAKDIRMHLD